MKAKCVVLWDIDDVLNKLTSELIAARGIALRSVSSPFGDVTAWFSAQGIDKDDYLNSLDEFRRFEYCRLSPNKDLIPLMVQVLERGASNLALSSCPTPFFSQVSEWVMRHFGPWLSGVNFVPSQRPGVLSGSNLATKHDFVSLLKGPSLLIDDSLDNLAGLNPPQSGLLYPQPWNSTTLNQDGTTNFEKDFCKELNTLCRDS